MVMAWACRLGMFLFARVLQDGKDSRFDVIKQVPRRFFTAWTIQGFWVFITLLPTLLLNDNPRDKPLGAQDWIGWSLWAIGMGLEMLADYQKSAFKRLPENQGKFITTGLWSISRHPNYFGEMMLWAGLYITASSVFRGYEYVSVLSPVFVCLLITKLSGVPMLEKSGLKRWGHLPEYQEYLRSTPVLVPFLNFF